MGFDGSAFLNTAGGFLNGYNSGKAQADAAAARDAQIKAAAEQAQQDHILRQQELDQQAAQSAASNKLTQSQIDAANDRSLRDQAVELNKQYPAIGNEDPSQQPSLVTGLNTAGAGNKYYSPFAVPGPTGKFTPTLDNPDYNPNLSLSTPGYGSDTLSMPSLAPPPAVGAVASLGAPPAPAGPTLAPQGPPRPTIADTLAPVTTGSIQSLQPPQTTGGDEITNPYLKPTLAGQATQADIAASKASAAAVRAKTVGTPEYKAAQDADYNSPQSVWDRRVTNRQLTDAEQKEKDAVAQAASDHTDPMELERLRQTGQMALQKDQEDWTANQSKNKLKPVSMTDLTKQVYDYVGKGDLANNDANTLNAMITGGVDDKGVSLSPKQITGLRALATQKAQAALWYKARATNTAQQWGIPMMADPNAASPTPGPIQGQKGVYSLVK